MKWFLTILHLYTVLPDVVAISLLMSVAIATNLFFEALYRSDLKIDIATDF